MPLPEPTERERVEHGWCIQLRQQQSFRYYLEELAKRTRIAHREVCAPKSPSREYEAGRLSAFSEAAQIIDSRYAVLAKIVEVIQ